MSTPHPSSNGTAAADDGFAAAWSSVDGVEGWMTEGQARLLWEAAQAAGPGGRTAEIGSYRGRSAIVLAKAAPAAGEIVAIDPHAGNDRGPQQIDGTSAEGESDHELFHSNLKAAGVDERIRHVRLPSARAHGSIEGSLDMLYIDGAHRYRPAAEDIHDWGARVKPGGTMLIHDSFASVGVTLAQARLLFFSRDWEYVRRSRSLAEYHHRRISGPTYRRSILRQSLELGYFAKNILIKVLLVAKLKPAAKLLDGGRGEWPY